LKVSDSEPIIEIRVPSKTGKPIPINFSIVAEVIVSSRFSDYFSSTWF
jgi:CRISPR-associated protein Csm5